MIFLVSVTPPNDPDITHLALLKTVFYRPELHLEAYDGIILTSKQGVKAAERIDPRWKHLPVFCVGRATQAAAEACGAEVPAVSDGYGAGLYEIIRQRYADWRWLYLRPKVVASDFAARLNAEGVRIDEVVVYETVCDPAVIPEKIPENAVLIFTSPSAADCFLRHRTSDISHQIVVIGKTTQKAVGTGANVHLAPEPTVAACIRLAKSLVHPQKP